MTEMQSAYITEARMVQMASELLEALREDDRLRPRVNETRRQNTVVRFLRKVLAEDEICRQNAIDSIIEKLDIELRAKKEGVL